MAAVPTKEDKLSWCLWQLKPAHLLVLVKSCFESACEVAAQLHKELQTHAPRMRCQ